MTAELSRQVVAVVVCVGAVYTGWRCWRRPGARAPLMLAIGLQANAVGFLFAVRTPSDAVSGGAVVELVAGVVAGWSAGGLAMEILDQDAARRRRGRSALLAAAIGGAAVVLVLVDVAIAAQLGPPTTASGGIVGTAARVLVTIYAIGQVMFIIRLLRPRIGRSAIGQAAGLFAAGCSLLVIWLVLVFLTLLAAHDFLWRWFPKDRSDFEMISWVGFILCVVAAVPSLIVSIRNAWGQYQTHRQLGPLWNCVTAHAPEVVYPSLPWWLPNVTWRLDRRIIEIEDGLILLSGRLHRPHSVQTSDGHQTVNTELAWSAHELALALHNVNAASETPDGSAVPRDRVDVTAPRDMTPDTWLVAVSQELRQLTSATRREK